MGMIDQALLKKLFVYDEEAGTLTRIIPTSPTAPAGRVAGWVAANGYRYISVGHGQYLAHRLVWLYMTGEFPASNVDHADGDRANNRWTNLRAANQSQNTANAKRRKTSSTGYKGVCWHRQAQKFYARINVKKKQISLGLYETAAQAHAAYISAAKKYFGEFARAA